MAHKQPENESTEDKAAHEEEIWLLGQPSLRKYLDFVEDMAVGGATVNPAVLAEEWRMANDYYRELEDREAGIADKVECRDLAPALAPLAAEIMAHPAYRQTFDTFPTGFGMVELDRLVLCQIHVTRNYVDALQSRLTPPPDPVTLIRFCLPLDQPVAPVQIRRVGSKRYVFRSDSMDFRFHEPVLLRPEQIQEYSTFGQIAGVVGLVVGFSSNFLNVIRFDDRLLLHNGYHRACALRAMGITHAPCVIQTVTRRDELNVIAKSNVVEDPNFYFRARRPPLLKDFFDPKIRKVLRIQKMVRMIEVNFEVRDFLAPA